MLQLAGDQSIVTILKHDHKTTSYRIALLRALNDLVLSYPGLPQHGQPVDIPLVRIAELWVAHYRPFMDEQQPIYQGARAQRDGSLRNDVSFWPALTQRRVAPATTHCPQARRRLFPAHRDAHAPSARHLPACSRRRPYPGPSRVGLCKAAVSISLIS